MVEVGGGLRLAAEPLDEGRVGGELGEQHLDRDRTVEQQVAGEEHVGHAAAPDAALQLVALVEDSGVGLRHVDPAYRPVVSRSGAARMVSITVLAIGAATRPPVCSLAPSLPEDDHGDRDPRVVGGREADDPRV